MTETFAVLLFAHVLADFVLQTRWMADGKAGHRSGPFLAHVAVVALTAIGVTGSLSPPVLILIVLHAAIDLAKMLLPLPKVAGFLADQAAHGLTLAAIAVAAPDLWAAGLWARIDWPGRDMLPGLSALLAGLILSTRAGGFAIGLLMQPWVGHVPVGLTHGGRVIGLLERGLIFVLILTGQSGGIGFLIAAKSVLRFGATGDASADDRAISEYIIIGTLASFGWAIVAAAGTLWLNSALPHPLHIPDLTP